MCYDMIVCDLERSYQIYRSLDFFEWLFAGSQEVAARGYLRRSLHKALACIINNDNITYSQRCRLTVLFSKVHSYASGWVGV